MARLRRLLVELYQDPGRARTIASDSGVPLRSVNFRQVPDAFWWEILTESRHQRVFGTLMRQAQKDYPSNKELADAVRELSVFTSTPSDPDALEILLKKRDSWIAMGRSVAVLDGQIKELKRASRKGPQLHAGEYLADRFLLIQEIGHGGFATVWEAHDRVAFGRVAVKVLHSQWSRDRSHIERFNRGARAMMRLAHPNVVRLVSPPIEENDFHHFAMEYAPGGDLREAVLKVGLPAETVLRVVAKIGAALHHAHERGVIHRDVKPANILLRADYTPVLTDFDLASLADSTGGTRTGALGTVVYSAPEMTMDAKTADHRADVYSLAMTTVFALTGRDLGVEAMRRTALVVKRLACTERVKEALLCALDEDPDARFQNVAAFCRALTGDDG